jgi:threonine/homoserine/homoserine lactone efflux protein
VDSGQLAWFLGASLLLILAPGPDILFLLSQAVAHGRRAGLVTALGLAAGNLGHTLAAALGVSALLAASEPAFLALKSAGAGYLLWLAWKTLAGRRQPADRSGVMAWPAPVVFRRALTMNLLNPKVALFFLAFLPQFANPERAPVGWQVLGLGLLFTLEVALVFGTLGLLAGQAGQRLLAAPGPWAGAVPWLVAGVFVVLAGRLVCSG